jgi:uncharacterized protein VirK/YbjX
MRQALIAQDKAIRAELQEVADQYATAIRAKHEAVVRDWTHRVKFQKRVSVSRRQVSATVWATGQHRKLYQWIDKGTQPYLILPRRAPYLTFRAGYDARTQAVARFNAGTGRHYGAWRRKRAVRHPGIRARKFSETFNQEILPDFRRDVENAIRRGLRRRKG